MVLKYNNITDLFNPFSIQKDIDFMKVDVIDEFVDHADFVDEYCEKNKLNSTEDIDNLI
jgi:hypothetical protein